MLNAFFSLQDFNKAHGSAVLMRNGIQFHDLGRIGGGTWSLLETLVLTLNHGPHTKAALLNGPHGDAGFQCAKDMNLIIRVSHHHPSSNAAVWQLNTNKATLKTSRLSRQLALC